MDVVLLHLQPVIPALDLHVGGIFSILLPLSLLPVDYLVVVPLGSGVHSTLLPADDVLGTRVYMLVFAVILL